jgi:hypothetical protein
MPVSATKKAPDLFSESRRYSFPTNPLLSAPSHVTVTDIIGVTALRGISGQHPTVRKFKPFLQFPHGPIKREAANRSPVVIDHPFSVFKLARDPVRDIDPLGCHGKPPAFSVFLFFLFLYFISLFLRSETRKVELGIKRK